MTTRPGPAMAERPARRPRSATPWSGRAAAPVIVGAVDVGSNSVHLLVAVVGPHRLEPLVDESVFLGLGAAADLGVLGGEVRSGLVEALVRYGETSRRLGANRIAFVGTEPMRRARDAAQVVVAVERACGLPLHVVSHEEEALLTLIGVTAGRPVRTDLAIVDVGGGSSEFVVVGPGRRARAFGMRIGGARLTERIGTGDPPSTDDVAGLRAAARELLAEAPDASIHRLVAVGGTASNLLRVLPSTALDRTLTPRRLAEAMDVLMSEPSPLAAEHHLIHPVRARILPAGAAIMEAILARYGLARVTVSEAGIREGTAFALAHAGAGWRDRLESLAHGWGR